MIVGGLWVVERRGEGCSESVLCFSPSTLILFQSRRLFVSWNSVACLLSAHYINLTVRSISAYLLYSKMQKDAESALDFYAAKRTVNRTGITIPSQRR